MRHLPFLALATLLLCPHARADDETATRLKELDAYWSEVSRAVAAGDFAAYSATCHKEGVLVSGKSKTSHALTEALERWEPGFQDTKDGKIKASVTFRFSQRFGNHNTAHETGMFLYSTVDAEGLTKRAYIHFEALLVKRGAWKIIMEYQKSEGTEAEWDALAPTSE